MSVPTGASMAGNSSRLANALRSAADGVAAEDATSSIASTRPVSQTVLGSTGGWDRPIVFRSTTVNNPHVQTGSLTVGGNPPPPSHYREDGQLRTPSPDFGKPAGGRGICGWASLDLRVRRLLRPWLPAACFSPATACRTSRANFRPRRMLACSGPVSNAISLKLLGRCSESRYESFPRLGSNADSSFRAQKSPGRCRGFELSKIQREEISTEIYPN
jgi:hypothetical protein